MRQLITVTLTLLLCLISSVFAYEDPRWERSGQGVKKPAVVSQPPVVSGQTVETKDDVISKYEEERLKRTISALKESPMPLRLPDTILRVMFLPYVDNKNVLRNSYYAFMKVEDGKWVMGDYLTAPTTTQKQAKGMVFTPLQVSLPVQPDTEKDTKKTEEKKLGEKKGETD